MRIVILRSTPVNPDSRVEKEANSLVKGGHSVIILGWERETGAVDTETEICLSDSKVKIMRFAESATFGGGMLNIKPELKIHVKMKRWLISHRNDYDAIHACDFDMAIVGYSIAKKYKKKLVYDIFDYYTEAHYIPGPLRKLINGIDRRIINYSDCTIICVESRKEQIKGSHPKRLEIIHNSPSEDMLDFSKNRIRLNPSQEQIRIVYVGILSKARLIKEIVDYVSKNPEFELHIAGFGQLEGEIRSAAEKFKNVIYYGKLSYPDALCLESQCNIMTSIYDPSIANHKYVASNKFYEAMMLGKPLIMVHNTGLDKVLDDNNIGATIEYSEAGFGEGVSRIVKNKNNWPAESKKMKQIFLSKYSWNIMEKKLLEIYSSI
jgi:glycosyltransferase involved in cell wall biosynthesis